MHNGRVLRARPWDTADWLTVTVGEGSSGSLGDPGRHAAGRAGTDEQAEQTEQTERTDSVDPSSLLVRVAGGDEDAFAVLYDAMTSRVYGAVRRVLRDPAQSEEVTQEIFVEVWRTAPRYDPSRASAATWILTIAHRRAVDRVRSAQSSTDREVAVGIREQSREYDEVADEVERRLEAEQVRRCLESLTVLQRESVHLAYYGGLTYAQVAVELGAALGTIKTRMRDGLIRLRDCLGVVA